MLKPEHIHISLHQRPELLVTQVRASLPLHYVEPVCAEDIPSPNHVAYTIRRLARTIYAELYQEVRDKLREIISQVADIPTLSYEDARILLHSLQDAHSITCPRGEDINNLVMSVLGSMHDTEAARGAIRQILPTNEDVIDTTELEEAKKFVREFLSEVDSDDPGEIWRESR